MNAGKRIIINTIAQYTRAIINTLLSLYSVRLILDVLGNSDYGIYSLIGGVIAMLGFITNALVITTQRYISYHYGQGEKPMVRRVFVNSLLLHAVFATSLFLIFIALREYIVFHILNIPTERLQTASHVYLLSSLMLAITILTAPFKALFIARENIVFISIVEVADGIVKVFLALCLAWIAYDKLLVYAIMMAMILFCNLLAYATYGLLRFDECTIVVRKADISMQLQRQLAGFAGWTTYGMACVACRTQGAAVILNHFFNTVINAAYGLANQVYGAIVFVSSSVLNAMNPQIMKSEGAGDRKKMLRLASQQSKFSAALMMIVAIPMMTEMEALISIWLKEVPEHTAMFCRFILISFICDQLTIGLNAANQATGKIKTYTLLMFTPKLLYLPIGWLILHFGGAPVDIMWLFLFIELGVALMRLPFMRVTVGLNIVEYLRNVFLPLMPLAIISTTAAFVCVETFHFRFRFILTMVVCVAIGMLVAWFLTLNSAERNSIRNIILRQRHANDI